VSSIESVGHGSGDGLWDRRRVAKFLGICQRKLHDLTKAGVIRCVRLGRRVLYDPDEVKACIKRLQGQPVGDE